MQVIECFDVQVWDGGDRHNHAFYLTSKVEVDKYIAEHQFDAAYARTLVFFDTLEEVAQNTTKKARESALAKLTPLERKALGL